MKKKGHRASDPFLTRESGKYQHPIPSREFILDYIESQKKPLAKQALIRHFAISGDFEMEAFRRRLSAMVRDGQLRKKRDGRYEIVVQLEAIRGRVAGHQDGFGFVEPEDGTSSLFISARQMRQVLDGDIVEARVTKVDQYNRREGVITKVLERKRKTIVGRFLEKEGIGFVAPDFQKISQDILISKAHQGEAKAGQMVVAEIVTPPTFNTQPIGRIIEVLGDYMAPGLEIDVAIRSYELPHHFPETVLTEAEKISPTISEAILKERQDVRTLPLITIDGEDAKDFDDAVFCEKNKQGGFHLMVAIADVSFFVKADTALDQAAYARGNSVYFPGRVVPMLPSVLSDDVCSLKPHVDRLCFVCDMQMSAAGELVAYRFYPAVMHSKARLTYTQVARFLETPEKPPATAWPKEVKENLTQLHALYQALSKARAKRGALEFETTEFRIQFGAGKKIKQLVPVVRTDAHRLIEECMLCANQAAALFLEKHQYLSLYRVHDGPARDKLENLKMTLKTLSLTLGGGDLPTPKDYAALLKKTANRPDAHLIQTLLLRSLGQAIYSPDMDLHFGLALSAYTHFTSPIRRYPDLLVHRAIRAILSKKAATQTDIKVWQQIGEHCSMTERRADEATRSAIHWLKCEYMLDKLGKEFEGVITGVVGFGVFVELKEIFVEGLLPIEAFPKAQYQFDAARHRLISRRTKKAYTLGDVLQVRVARVDMEMKQIRFVLSES